MRKKKPRCEFCGAEKRLDYELGGYCCPNYCTFKSSGGFVADLIGRPVPTSTDGREHR